MKTLAEINATRNTEDVRFGEFVTVRRAAVGRVGHRRSGDKIHFLNAEFFVRYLDGAVIPGRQKREGDVFSAYAPCNGNGQHVGQVVRNLDTVDINCQKCLKALGVDAPTDTDRTAKKAADDAAYQERQAKARQNAAETKAILAHSRDIDIACEALQSFRAGAATAEQHRRINDLISQVIAVAYQKTY